MDRAERGRIGPRRLPPQMHAELIGPLPGLAAGAHPTSAKVADWWKDRMHKATYRDRPLLPLPLLSPPQRPLSRSARLEQRFKLKSQLYQIAMGTAVGCAWLWNARGRPFLPGPAQSLEEMDPVHKEAWLHLLSEAKSLRSARRAAELTGEPALEELIKQQLQGVYLQNEGSPYTPLSANLVAEPTEPNQTVDLLTARPPEMAALYASEEDLFVGRSWCEEERALCRRLGHTVGGSKREYALYFRHPDVQPLWGYLEPADVKGTCAFKAVWKKDGKAQRNILAALEANCVWGAPPCERDLGLWGGTALCIIIL